MPFNFDRDFVEPAEWELVSTDSPCVLCGKLTNYFRGDVGRIAVAVCRKCGETLDRKDPWWLRAARWIAR